MQNHQYWLCPCPFPLLTVLSANQHRTEQNKIALHCAALYCTYLQCNILHCTTLQCALFHCTAPKCAALQYMNYTALCCTVAESPIINSKPQIQHPKSPNPPSPNLSISKLALPKYPNHPIPQSLNPQVNPSANTPNPPISQYIRPPLHCIALY